MKRVLLGVLVLLGPARPAWAESVSVSADPLPALIAEALERNPEVRAARERERAARLRVPQAAALPDPTAGYMVMGEMLETRLGPQEDVYELEQMIPFPGKLWQRRQMAAAEARAAQAQRRMAELGVAQQVRDAYADLYATDVALTIVGEVQQLLRSFEGVAQARYAAQGGVQRDVVKAQVEVSETIQRLLQLRQERLALEALLNALLDRDPGRPIDAVRALPLPSARFTLEELLLMARRSRPELQEAQAMVGRERHARRLAAMDYAPDVSVGIQYVGIGSGMTTDPDDGRDAWMVPIKVTIPLWQNRLLPAVGEAARNLRASEAGAEQAQNLTGATVRQAHAAYVAATQTLELYQHALVPEAEMAFRADRAGYEAGRADVLELIDSGRVYLNVRVAAVRAEADALKRFAALERAVGQSLSGDAAPGGARSQEASP
jgi:outer membrane protein TolC